MGFLESVETMEFMGFFESVETMESMESMEFMESMGFLESMESMQAMASMECHGVPLSSMDVHGNHGIYGIRGIQDILEIHRIRGFRGIQGCHGYTWISMDIQGYRCIDTCTHASSMNYWYNGQSFSGPNLKRKQGLDSRNGNGTGLRRQQTR